MFRRGATVAVTTCVNEWVLKNTYATMQINPSRCWKIRIARKLSNWKLVVVDGDVRKAKDYLITWRIRASQLHVPRHRRHFTMQLNLI